MIDIDERRRVVGRYEIQMAILQGSSPRPCCDHMALAYTRLRSLTSSVVRPGETFVGGEGLPFVLLELATHSLSPDLL